MILNTVYSYRNDKRYCKHILSQQIYTHLCIFGMYNEYSLCTTFIKRGCSSVQLVQRHNSYTSAVCLCGFVCQFTRPERVLYCVDMDLVASEADILESVTEDLMCSYERLIRSIQDCIKMADISLEKLIAKILKWKYISHDFRFEIAQAKTTDSVFEIIRIFSKWYQIEFLDHIVDFPSLAGFVCLKKLTDYKERLKSYLESRMKQLARKVGSGEEIVLLTDKSWDKRMLQGQHCRKTCKQIALALGKEGRITGHLDGEHLHIAISD